VNATRHPRRRLAAQMLVLCCAFWAVSFPAVKALEIIGRLRTPENSSVFFAAACVCLRFAISAAAVVLFAFPRLRHMTRMEWKQGVGLGILGSLGLLLQVDGMAYTQASTSAFLTQGYCVWLPLWVALRHRRFPSWIVLSASVLVLLGGAVLSGVSWERPALGRGEWETLAGSVAFTGQILWLERPEFRGNDVLRFSAVMFAVLALCTLPLALATAQRPSDLATVFASPAAMGLIGVLVVFCTLVAFLLANRWQPEVPATEAGLLYSTEPVFTAALALVLPGWISRGAGIEYPNERLTWNLVIGGGLVLAANAWLQLGHISRDPAAAPAAHETPVAGRVNDER